MNRQEQISRPLGRGRPHKRRVAKGTIQVAKNAWRPRMLIRKVRIAKGLSQLDLAKRLNVQQSRVSSWERGYVTPSWGILRQIAAALGCEVLSDLIDPVSRFDEDNLPFNQSG